MAERNNSRVVAAIALLCAAMIGAVFSIGRMQRMDQGAPYSSLGTGPAGLKAVRMLMEARGCKIETMGVPLSEAPADTRLLFVIQPFGLLSKEDRQMALTRVRNGLTLVLMGSAVQAFSETLDVRLDLSGDNDIHLEPQAPAEFLSGVPGILVPAGARLHASGKAINYFGDEDGGVVSEFVLGRGRIIAMSDAGLFTNEVVDAEPGNALLCLALAQFHGKTAAFAEYYHGIRSSESNARDRSPIPLYMQLAFWQVLMVIVLAVLIAGWRFGRPLPMPLPTGRRSIGEFVRSMGGLYRKAGAGQIVLDDLYRNLLRSMQKYCGYNYAVPTERLIQECAFRKGTDPGNLRRLFRRCEEALNGQGLRERELMMLSKEMDRYRKEFERYGSGQ